MKVTVIGEYGYFQAVFGLGLSRGITSGMSYADFINDEKAVGRMRDVALTLTDKDGGHNQFLENIIVWLDVTAPIYWWSQFDRYRIGVSPAANGLQSESTMNTILERPLAASDFEEDIPVNTLDYLNELIKAKCKLAVKKQLPGCFRQRREICTNYLTIRRINLQRRNHELPEWHTFIKSIRKQLGYAFFLLECTYE